MLSAFSWQSLASWLSLYSLASLLVYGLGILNAAHAVMNVPSSRGAIAWSISLITMPWVAIPLYWILGKNKFRGYAESLQRAYSEHRHLVHRAYGEILEFKAQLPEPFVSLEKLIDKITPLPFTTNNRVSLLIDGEHTYPHMLQAIQAAQDYILLQTYILHSDEIGNQFRAALIDKARQGVRIYLLYDSIGSHKLPGRYIRSLRESGIEVRRFRSTLGTRSRFQINFRNHRKILIIDGKIAFVGGLNIGDEYLGKDPKLGDWRDTHIKVEGTAIKCLQRTFLGDWYWASKALPKVAWKVSPAAEYGQTAFVLATGPADPLQACELFFLNLINRAQTRLWIASPYFVPSSSVLNALKLAAIRGVDVRILLPNRPDHLLVYLCSFSYYEELRSVGIQVYRYQPGFMHQKVILCDRTLAGVGTVNLDNRSFFLNFEVMTFVVNTQEVNAQEVNAQEVNAQEVNAQVTEASADLTTKTAAIAESSKEIATNADFINRIEHMLLNDFEASRRVDLSTYSRKPLWFKLAARTSRLLGPIL